MANDESGPREEGPKERVDRENAPTERSAGFGRGDREATLPTQNLDDLDAAAADAAELADDRDNALLRAIAAAPSRRPPSAVVPGSHWGALDRYVIGHRLGRGGMGTVYEATCTVLHRTVALKVLDVGEPDAAHYARLVREARVPAGVEHERIARVYDVGVHEGFPFVAMEYVSGGTLRQWMAKGARPLPQVLDVVTQIAEGLAELHGKGVVHRDLKPENVMRTAAGGIKLVDFGLARNSGALAASHLPLAGNRPVAEGTSTAASSGTPGYMAPEQCTGKPIDARADIFALGVILYELIAQAKPFRGTTIGAIVDATLEGVPIPSDGPWSAVPAGLRAHVARMLAPTPEDRFADGAAALEALREVTAEASKPGRQSGGIARAPTERPARPPAIVDVGQVGRGLELPVALTGVAVLALAAFLPTKPDGPIAPAGMAYIAGGELDVGRSPFEVERECLELGEGCRRDRMYAEAPRTTVKVAPFFLDREEVTNEQFARLLNQYVGSLVVVEDQESGQPRFVRLGRALDGDLLYDLDRTSGAIEYVAANDTHHFQVRAGAEKLPATHMSWFGAQRYCEFYGKRLPTENEWEAAARGRDDRRFPWGNEIPKCGHVAIHGDQWIPGTEACSSTDVAQAVGTMTQDVTSDGIHDLGGNVSEWTATRFVEGNRAAQPADGPHDAARVIRGGAWSASFMVRTSARLPVPAPLMGADIGFRCALSATDMRR